MAVDALSREIAKAMRTVRQRKIVARVVALIRHFKGEHMEGRSDHTRVRGSITLSVAGTPTEFNEESFGQFHEYLRICVYFGGLLVFEAVHGPSGSSSRVDPRRVIREVGSDTEVRVFGPGVWMQLLDLKRLIRQQEQLRREQELTRQKASVAVQSGPPRENDHDMAQRFGLRTR